MSLSIKQALKAPEPEPAEEPEEEEVEAPAPRKRTTPLRGGVGNREFKMPEPGPQE
jgi:hypothetical protein